MAFRREKLDTSRTKNSRVKTSPSPIRHFMKEIVIKTEYPDLPEITILKTQTDAQNNFIQTALSLEQILYTQKLKRLHYGFSRISQCKYRANLSKGKVREVVQILNHRLNRLKNHAWVKMKSYKNKFNHKLHICRLLNKISCNLLNKMKLAGFLKMRMLLAQKEVKNDEEVKNLNRSLSQIRSKFKDINDGQFSQKFLTVCMKLKKININNHTNFTKICITDLVPALSEELKVFQIPHKGQNQIRKNNQLVLIVMNNQSSVLKNLSQSLELKNEKILQLEETSNNKESNSQFEQEIEKLIKQIQKNDEQIKKNLQASKVVEAKEIKKIIEKQMKFFELKKQKPFINSRQFISTLLIKFLQVPGRVQTEISDLCQNSKKINKLEAYKVALKKKHPSDRHDQWLIGLAQTLIDLQQTQANKIKEEPISQNYESMLSQLQVICSEIREYLKSKNNKNKKIQALTFEKIKNKSAQLEELYKSLEELVKQQGDETNLPTQTSNDLQAVQAYLKCLQSGDYDEWVRYSGKFQNKKLLNALNAINDQLNLLISQEVQEHTKMSKSNTSRSNKKEQELKDELKAMKSKYEQLQRSSVQNKSKLQKRNKTLSNQVKQLQDELKENKKLLQEKQKPVEQPVIMTKPQEPITQKPSKQIVILEEQNAELKSINEYLTERITKLTNQMEKILQDHEKKQKDLKENKQIQIKDGKTIENLNRRVHSLEAELKMKEQLMKESTKKMEDWNKQVSECSSEREKQAFKKLQEESVSSKNLMDQLNSQLIKLKKNEHTLEQINKDIEKTNINTNTHSNLEIQSYKTLILQLQERQHMSKIELDNKHKYIVRLQEMLKIKDQELWKLENILRQKSDVIEMLNQKLRKSLQSNEQMKKNKKESNILDSRIHESYDSLINELSLKNEAISRLQQKANEELKRKEQQKMIELQKKQQEKQFQITKRQQEKQNIIKQTTSTIINLQNIIKQKESIILFQGKKAKELLDSSSFMTQQQEDKIAQLQRNLLMVSEEVSFYKNQSLHQPNTTNIDNVIVLLFNILTKYIEKSTTSKQKEEIRRELNNIKNQFSGDQQQFYMNLQKFAIWIVNNDISAYRSHLQFLIEKLYSFKIKVQGLLEQELEEAKEVIHTTYEFDEVDKSKFTFGQGCLQSQIGIVGGRSEKKFENSTGQKSQQSPLKGSGSERPIKILFNNSNNITQAS